MTKPFQQIIEKLDELVQAQNDNRNLWSAQRCASYFNISSVRFRSSIACKPNFPKPVKLHNTAHPLWFPDEVKRYAKNHQSI